MSGGSGAVYPHPAALPDDALLAACSSSLERTSGPGGQHRNKVSTQVVLRHDATGLEAHAGERRTVRENRPVAIRRLRLRLAVEHRAPVPDGEIGSALWRSRRTKMKQPPKQREPKDPVFEQLGVTLRTEPDRPRFRIACNPKHRDYPALLAECLDAIAAAGWDPKPAALRLGVSASQLVKLLRDHPPALAKLNDEREARGMHKLK